MKDLRIVIPAYNEEAGIGSVIDRIKATCPDAEIVVVDDGSTDKTVDIAQSKNVKVIRHPTNYGYGKALKTGFGYGSKEHIKYFAFLDSDNTYPPEIVPQMYNLCKEEGVDIVVGSRFLGSNNCMPFVRGFGNKLFAFMTSIYTGKHVTDAGSGFRVFKASLLQEFLNLPDELSFTPGMTLKALHLGLSYKEVPIEYSERIGKSKLRWISDGYRFLKIIIGITKNHKPLLLFVTLSVPFLISGVFLGAYAMFRWLGGALFTPSFILTALLILLGVIILLFGLIADMIVDLRRIIERLQRETGK